MSGEQLLFEFCDKDSDIEDIPDIEGTPDIDVWYDELGKETLDCQYRFVWNTDLCSC